MLFQALGLPNLQKPMVYLALSCPGPPKPSKNYSFHALSCPGAPEPQKTVVSHAPGGSRGLLSGPSGSPVWLIWELPWGIPASLEVPPPLPSPKSAHPRKRFNNKPPFLGAAVGNQKNPSLGPPSQPGYPLFLFLSFAQRTEKQIR